MGLSISWEVVLFFALGMALLYGVGWLLLVPFKKGLYFLFNSLVGGPLAVGGVPCGRELWPVAVINPFSAILTGFLGIPGVALTLLIQNCCERKPQKGDLDTCRRKSVRRGRRSARPSSPLRRSICRAFPPARVADMPLQLCIARGRRSSAWRMPSRARGTSSACRASPSCTLQRAGPGRRAAARPGRGGAAARVRGGLRGLGGRLRRAVLPEKRLCAGGAEDLRALGRDGAARRGLRRHGQAQPHRGARRRAQLLCVPEGIVTNFNTKQRSYCLYT